MKKEVIQEYLDALLDKAVLAKAKKFEIDKRKIELFHTLHQFYIDENMFKSSEEMDPNLKDTLKDFALMMKTEDMPFVEEWFESVKLIVTIFDKHRNKLKKDDPIKKELLEYRKVMKTTNGTVTRLFHNVRHELRIAKRTSKKNYHQEFDDLDKLVRLEREAVEDIKEELMQLEPALKSLILKLASMKIPGEAKYEKKYMNYFLCLYAAATHIVLVSIPIAGKEIKADLRIIIDSTMKCHEFAAEHRLNFFDYRIMHKVTRKIPVKVDKIKTEYKT